MNYRDVIVEHSNRAIWEDSLRKIRSSIAEYFRSTFSIDSRSLSLFRIVLGLILLVESYNMLVWANDFYVGEGAAIRYSFFKWIPEWAAKYLIAVQAVAALFFTTGTRSRISGLIVWLCLLSAHNFSPLIIHGGDTLLRLLLFWSLFVDLERHYSLRMAPGERLEPVRYFNVVTVILFLQVGCMYLITALAKSGQTWRADGSAIYYSLLLEHYSSPIGAYLANYPAFLHVVTRATLILEDCAFFLMFLPVYAVQIRRYLVPAFILFHLAGIGLCFRLGLFPWICAAAWVLFIPSAFFSLRSNNTSILPAISTDPTSSRYKVAAAYLLAVLFVSGLASALVKAVPEMEFLDSPPAREINQVLGLSQNWNLFAPNPALVSKRHAIRVRFKDGTQEELPFDVLLSRIRPAQLQLPFTGSLNIRWRKLLLNLQKDKPAVLKILAQLEKPVAQLFPEKESEAIFLVEYSRPNWPNLEPEFKESMSLPLSSAAR